MKNVHEAVAGAQAYRSGLSPEYSEIVEEVSNTCALFQESLAQASLERPEFMLLRLTILGFGGAYESGKQQVFMWRVLQAMQDMEIPLSNQKILDYVNHQNAIGDME